MFKTPVFRFTYFDRARAVVAESPDYATREAIAAMGATAIEETQMLVDARLVGAAGLILRDRMPVDDESGPLHYADRRESSS